MLHLLRSVSQASRPSHYVPWQSTHNMNNMRGASGARRTLGRQGSGEKRTVGRVADSDVVLIPSGIVRTRIRLEF